MFRISANLWIKIAITLIIYQEKWHQSVGKEVPIACGVEGVCHCSYFSVDDMYVDCLERNLSKIPRNIPADTNTLYLSSCTLKSIPADFLLFVTTLQEIDLSNNIISEIPPTLFSPKNLSKINSLSVISNQLVQNLTLLTSLDLTENKLQNIPHHLLTLADNLKVLNFDHNNLTTLPETIFKTNVNLLRIFLKANRIQYLPGRLFSQTKMLKALHLSFNELTVIPQQLFSSLHYLTFLNLESNKLVEICTTCFGGLHQLKALYLSENRLRNLHGNLFSQTTMLEKLDLSNNRIMQLPDGLFYTTNKTHRLSTLFLQGNFLTHLSSKVFRGLENLETLWLFDNMIREISINSFESEAISELHLYGNKIIHFKRNSTQTMVAGPKVYINCEYLQEVQHLHVQITCVNPMYVPKMKINNINIASLMMKEGFYCIPVHRTIKLPPVFTCTPCERGTYANGRNECLQCPKGGFYQDRIGVHISTQGEIGCKKCQNGTFVQEDGSVSFKDCVVCPEGTNKEIHSAFRACFCSDGFARRDRFGPCHACLEGLNCSAGQDFQTLNAGYYWNWTFPDANRTEYLKFVANLETLSMNYDSHTSYQLQIPRAHKCPNPSSCINDAKQYGSIIGNCAPGYTGWLCNKCKHGFYTIMNKCFRCPHVIYIFMQMFFLACFCAVIFYFTCRQCRGPGGNKNGNRGFSSIFVSRFKICLGFYQVMGEFWRSFHGVQFTGNFQLLGCFINFVEINVIQVFIRPNCLSHNFTLNPQTEFVAAMSVVILLTVGPCVIYTLYTFCRFKSSLFKRQNPDANVQSTSHGLKRGLLTFVIVSLFIMYPQICKIIFQMYPLACKTFCLDMNSKHCITVLRSDFEVRCDQLTAYQVAAYLATILFVFGLPLTLMYLLRKYYSRNGEGESKMSPNKHNAGIEKVISLVIVFLKENYRTNYYYWEVLELVRKVAQTMTGTLFGWDNSLSILLTIGTSVMFIVLHAKHTPMKDATDQKLQLYSLCVILINMVVVTVRVTFPHRDWVLILLNISVFAFIIADAIIGILFQLKRSLKRGPKPE